MQIFYKKKSAMPDKKLIVLAFTCLFLLILLRTAWITDDAAITLRTVLNFIHGFGPTFNIDERVQAYTHPLWFLIITLGSTVSGNVFYTTFFVSIVFSVAAFALLLRSVSHNYCMVGLIGLASVLSKAFVDFSTSGLENPLSHMLLLFAVFSTSCHDEREGGGQITFFLICSALYLNRPDLLLMVFPLAVYLTQFSIHRPRKLATDLLFAAVPVIIWTTFSIIYYGFPFPNTAYAKLGTGIPIDERFFQGIRYFAHCIDRDPVTIFVIVLGSIVGLRGSRLNKSLASGVIFYLMYILYIGGDFMEGRFLTAPFFMSLIIFSREISTQALAIVLIAPVIVLGSVNIYSNVLAGSSYSNSKIAANGIADERGYYFQNYGLLTAKKNTFIAPKWQASDRKVNIMCGHLGFNSIKQGPRMHYIDNCALTDPLLSRLPAKADSSWRSGHFFRQLPSDYMESIEKDKNLIFDPRTARLWDSIRMITRGPLFEIDRFSEIAKLNFGFVEKPDLEMYRTQRIPRRSTVPVVFEKDINTFRADGTAWDAAGNIVFDDVLEIVLTQVKDIESIDLSADHNDTYAIFGMQSQKWIRLATTIPKNGGGLLNYHFSFKPAVANIEKIRVTVKSGDEMHSVGHLLINGRSN